MSAARFLVALGAEKPEAMTLRACVVLLTLAEQSKPITSKQLSLKADVPGPTLCRIMDVLEPLRFARRFEGNAYRQRRLVEILPAGRAFCERINVSFAAALPPTADRRATVAA